MHDVQDAILNYIKDAREHLGPTLLKVGNQLPQGQWLALPPTSRFPAASACYFPGWGVCVGRGRSFP
jgi:hypothetical protein